MVGDTRQGWAMLAAMLVIFVPLTFGAYVAEQTGNPRLTRWASTRVASATQSGGNMEGKEVRFGIANSALWATATTAASNGSVNSMHDSYTPLGGLVPMWLMQLGEVVFGGVGSGLYGMLMFAIVAVFIGGPDGRTHAGVPRQEDRGVRDQDGLARDARSAVDRAGGHSDRQCRRRRPSVSVANPGAHGFSRDPLCVLFRRQQQWQRVRGTVGQHALLQRGARRRDVGIALLADDSSTGPGRQPRSQEDTPPSTAGTLPTHTPLFITLLVGVVLMVGALTFVPALALGPIVEHLQMMLAERMTASQCSRNEAR